MMLSSVEADLARRDPDIPGLATVLDPDAFRDALQRVARGPEVGRAEIAYVKYSPRAFCRVAYRVDVAGTQHDLDVRACRPEDLAAWLEKTGEVAVADPFGSGRMVLDDASVLVTVFPHDLRLPQLLSLVDPKPRGRLLRELLPDLPELWNADIRCLRYWPERRYSAELRAPDGTRALLKAYTPRGYLRARRNARAFRSNPPLRVARVLGWSDYHHLMAFEWIPGVMLSDLWGAGEMDWRVIAGIGSALAALHAQPGEGLRDWTRDDEVPYLTSLAREIGFICPELAGRTEGLARRLASRLESAPAVSLPVHGDFSGGQVLIDGEQVSIVDLDSAYRGDPADDLGGFLSQMVALELRGRLSPPDVEKTQYALLGGYRRLTHRTSPERIGLYVAAGLLRRARYGFRARTDNWRELIDASLERAEAILANSA